MFQHIVDDVIPIFLSHSNIWPVSCTFCLQKKIQGKLELKRHQKEHVQLRFGVQKSRVL